MSRARGFTIAETLVVAVILGLMLTAIAGAMAPLFSAPDRTQAKSESLGPLSSGVWMLERDVREGAAIATFACDGAPPTCGDGDGASSVTGLAVPTARTSGAPDAPLVTDQHDGTPQWDGFIVYRPAARGAQLERTFVPSPALGVEMANAPSDRTRLAMLAAGAVLAAQTLKPDVSIHDIASVAVAVDVSSGVTSLHVVSTGESRGHTNTTAVDDAILARN